LHPIVQSVIFHRMNLRTLAERLEERLKLPLPGARVHDLMRATPVGPLRPDFTHKLPPRPGAVLIFLYEDDGHIRLPLIKRQEYLGAHSGQISLPGGKAEEGEDAVTTALREGEEEIGLDRNEVQVIGKLSDFFVIPSNFLVTPVIVTTPHVPKLNPDPREVARILTGDLFELTKDDAILNKEILAAGTFRMMAPHFEIEGEVVWGATAMILNELCHIVRDLDQ
jgi:8-oxo-dGTP pyrophosphatase MutT (NUDIX family)